MRRYEEHEKEKTTLQELEWLRLRKIWVLMINYIRDPKTKPLPFKETDLITLSFDDEKEEEKKPLTPEQVEKMFPKTLNKNGKL